MISIISIHTTPQSDLNYRIGVEIKQQWTDLRLMYETSMPKDVALNGKYHVKDIWTPKSVVRLGTTHHYTPQLSTALRVFYNGTVQYTTPMVLPVLCRSQLEVFPFDEPLCTFTIESDAYDDNQVAYHWLGKKPVVKSMSAFLFNADLIHTTYSICTKNQATIANGSCLFTAMRFDRDSSYYYTTIFIPGMIFVTSAFVSFWISARCAPPRAILGTTTRVNFMSTSNSYRNALPVLTNMYALNVWDSVSLFFIYTALLEYLIVAHMDRHPIKHPEKMRKCTFLGIPWPPKYTNTEIVDLIEIYSRIVFPIGYLIFIICFFASYDRVHHIDYVQL